MNTTTIVIGIITLCVLCCIWGIIECECGNDGGPDNPANPPAIEITVSPLV